MWLSNMMVNGWRKQKKKKTTDFFFLKISQLNGTPLSPQMAAHVAHFPGHSRASLRKLNLSCLMAARSPKYYYLVIHDTHKLLLRGSEVEWDLGLIHSQARGKVWELSVCLPTCLGSAPPLPASTLPQTKQNRFFFVGWVIGWNVHPC